MFSMGERYFAGATKAKRSCASGVREGSSPCGVSADMTRLLTSLTAFAAAGALIAGCGGGSSSSGSSSGGGGGGGGYGGSAPAKTTAAAPATPAASTAAGSKLALKAVESNGLSFDHKTLSAKAGTVTITMDNPSGDSQPHAISIEGPGGVSGSGQIAQPGSTSKVSLKLKPGKYTFFCPVGAHRAAGMEGTLTVQ
jgi:plastocyanin